MTPIDFLDVLIKNNFYISIRRESISESADQVQFWYNAKIDVYSPEDYYLISNASFAHPTLEGCLVEFLQAITNYRYDFETLQEAEKDLGCLKRWTAEIYKKITKQFYDVHPEAQDQVSAPIVIDEDNRDKIVRPFTNDEPFIFQIPDQPGLEPLDEDY